LVAADGKQTCSRQGYFLKLERMQHVESPFLKNETETHINGLQIPVNEY
jgi:hypothetical protein